MLTVKLRDWKRNQVLGVTIDLFHERNETAFLRRLTACENCNHVQWDEYEQKFLNDMRERYKLEGNKLKLTRKQWNYLDDLWSETK